MKFSIVTISYNQSEFLERTIQSVLSQRDVDFEYIVVDPGSTDGSRDIIESYRNRIDAIIYDKDRGAADGLNNGFASAQGDIFGYLNSDDTLEPGALLQIAQKFKDHPWADVVSGGAWVVDRSDTRLRRVWSEKFHPWMFCMGLSIQIQPSTFFTREIFRKAGGFNIDNKCCWDGELMLDFHLKEARLLVIKDILSNYRLHSDSITNSGRLASNIRSELDRSFYRVYKRPKSHADRMAGVIARYARHALSPSATLERLLKGPVFNRGVE